MRWRPISEFSLNEVFDLEEVLMALSLKAPKKPFGFTKCLATYSVEYDKDKDRSFLCFYVYPDSLDIRLTKEDVSHFFIIDQLKGEL